MKLGIISDIHGDKLALELAWAHLTVLGADRIVCAGDLVGYGPHPDEVVAFVREYRIACVRGNHDRWAIERRQGIPGTPSTKCQWAEILGESFAVKLVDRAERGLKSAQLLGRGCVGRTIVAPGVMPECQNDFGHRRLDRHHAPRKHRLGWAVTSHRQLLGDDASVFLPAHIGTMLAEVDVSAVKPDNDLTGGLMEPAGGDFSRSGMHGAKSKDALNGSATI